MSIESISPGHGQARSNVRSHKAITEKDFKGLAARIAQACPITWMAITGKRYILPNFRQVDYYNQESLDHIFGFFLSTYVAGDYGASPDHIIRLMYLTSILAMKDQRPIYFLERELGQKLMCTKMPGDLETDDIHWRRASMRIMLPKGLITIQRDGQEERDAMFLDIAKAKAGELSQLSPEMTHELSNFALMYGRLKMRDIPTPVFEKDGMVVCSQLSGDINMDPGLNYGVVRPFEGRKIKDIQVGGHFTTGSTCDSTDDQLLARMEHLAVMVLLFMGSVPLEYEVKEADPLRKVRQINDRIIPGLWPAKFMGKSQYRPSSKTTHYHEATFTGRKLPKHWVAGHWKRQVYGMKRGERKLIWIEPYTTLGPDDQDPDIKP